MPRKIEKEAALERALTLFWDHGYRGTSMEMLTAHLGVEKPSIYASFGSKHDLYLEALRQYRKLMIDTVRELLSAAPTARAGIEQALRTIMPSSGRRKRRGCFATNSTLELADHNPRVLEVLKGTFEELAEVFTAKIRRGQSQGDIRSDVPAETLAQLLINAIEGSRIMEKARLPKFKAAAVAELILGLLDPPKSGG
jgi:TetR/AcrR family transcriptional repressor of nem operon